jgi:ribosomal protein S18 acetylase RimI-like enzyme
MIAADPSEQQQGIGKRMLAEAEKHAVEAFGVAGFRMSVLSARAELIRFYERRGYSRIGDSQAYPAAAGTGRPLAQGLQVETLVKSA